MKVMGMFQQTNEIVSIAWAAQTVEMRKTAANEVQHEQIPRGREKRFEGVFFFSFMNR